MELNDTNNISLDERESSTLEDEEWAQKEALDDTKQPQHHSTTTTVTSANIQDDRKTSTSSNTKENANPNKSFGTYVIRCKSATQNALNHPLLQKFGSIIFTLLCFFFMRKFMRPSALEEFLSWMEHHPIKGIIGYALIYPFHMIFFFPGTPLVMGGGFVFKLRFGWVCGVLLCSLVTLFGSLMGSVMCFLLGRYWIRATVRRWAKKYPLFDAIDAAVSENGFKIMCMLYLTPIIPLGPTSYMMGTTSMPLIAFAKAKIAALPLTVLYVYLGAAAGTLLTDAEGIEGDSASNGGNATKKASMEHVSLPPQLIITGILFSIGIISLITIKMKKELQKTLDKQKGKDDEDIYISDAEMSNEDLALHKQSKGRTRHRHIAPKKSLAHTDLS